MSNLKEMAANELKRVEEMIRINDSRMKKLSGVPEWKLKVINNDGFFQYYRRKKDEDKYTYVKTEEKDIVQRRVQLDYEIMVNRKLKEEQKALKSFIDHFEGNVVGKTYIKLSEGRKCLVNPIELPDEDFIKQWKEKNKGNQNTYPMKTAYETMNGENVRSKSEKIIADMLYKAGVPYQYEAEFNIGKDGVCYPDFLVLNVRERKTYIWEHLGLCDSDEYVANNLKKIAKYEKNGMLLGRDLIVTIESEETPLNIKGVEKKIEKML